ncbi:MAG TPA: MYXO-CTERM sorting domain-containing protein, partial [Polyangiaceae bacterium]|nr:MYXO-CTERM sorting domain-containing protein [Polyangiaceae bacterium]
KDYDLSVDGMTPVDASNPAAVLLTVDVPPNQVVKLGVHAKEYEPKAPCPPTGCGCSRTESTGACAPLAGLVVALYGRRRRQRRSKN